MLITSIKIKEVQGRRNSIQTNQTKQRAKLEGPCQNMSKMFNSRTDLDRAQTHSSAGSVFLMPTEEDLVGLCLVWSCLFVRLQDRYKKKKIRINPVYFCAFSSQLRPSQHGGRSDVRQQRCPGSSHPCHVFLVEQEVLVYMRRPAVERALLRYFSQKSMTVVSLSHTSCSAQTFSRLSTGRRQMHRPEVVRSIRFIVPVIGGCQWRS